MHRPDPASELAAKLFRVLAHPGRLEVLRILARSAPRPAGELAQATGMEQSSMSHQLRLLRQSRLVVGERVGRRMMYRLADEHVARIVSDAVAHVQE